ncbi:MAG: acyltransferase [Cytophagaceae bacterium]|jgi:peptidoglycan/LPS O-acetylase OafA/YrhL|nr:acyltransferase [Cytophagaceae bacterium]
MISLLKKHVSYFNTQALLERRNVGLDVMRGIGLLMVLIGHSLHFFEPFYPKIFRISHFVINGIELFFALSGFLIGRILVKQFIEKNDFTASSFLIFLKRRWFKTLPVYYLALGINLVVGFYFTGYHKDYNWKYLFFLHNITESDDWFFPISYSLAMEEWFYLLLPAIFLVSAATLRKYVHPISVLLFVCLAYIVVSIMIRTYLYEMYHPHWDTVMRKSLLSRIDCSVYGIIIAILFYKKNKWFVDYANHLFVSGVVLHIFSMYFRITSTQGYFYNVIYFTTIPLSFSVMLPALYNLKIQEGLLKTIFTYLSMVSFAFYLFHLSPLIDLFLPLTTGHSAMTVTFIYLLYLIVTFSLATLWYRYVEKPFTDLREKY